MAVFELIMPKMGESVIEATIISWSKKPGDSVEEDETVLEVATDKVDSEVPSPVQGKLLKILHPENSVVAVGAALALIETDNPLSPAEEDRNGEASMDYPMDPKPVKEEAIEKERSDLPIYEGIRGISEKQVAAPEESKLSFSEFTESKQALPSNLKGRFYSPLVRSIALREGISTEELETIPGSGAGGRVNRSDIEDYLFSRQSGSILKTKPGTQKSFQEIPQEPPSGKAMTEPQSSIGNAGTTHASDPHVEIVEMDRMRKLIADHMVRSKQISPHVCSFVEADVTGMALWREKVKKEFESRYKTRLTFSPLFAQAVIRAIGDFPRVNASVLSDQRIAIKKQINLGIATAMDNGNLIVPVIKDAGILNLAGLAQKLNDLTARARIGKLLPDEIQDGSFTITNIGTFGNLMGTPIINQPQLAILATGAIQKKPVVKETDQGDIIAIRHMMFLSLSYDHRVIDGILGGSFLKRIADYIESFDTEQAI